MLTNLFKSAVWNIRMRLLANKHDYESTIGANQGIFDKYNRLTSELEGLPEETEGYLCVSMGFLMHQGRVTNFVDYVEEFKLFVEKLIDALETPDKRRQIEEEITDPEQLMIASKRLIVVLNYLDDGLKKANSDYLELVKDYYDIPINPYWIDMGGAIYSAQEKDDPSVGLLATNL